MVKVYVIPQHMPHFPTTMGPFTPSPISFRLFLDLRMVGKALALQRAGRDIIRMEVCVSWVLQPWYGLWFVICGLLCLWYFAGLAKVILV